MNHIIRINTSPQSDQPLQGRAFLNLKLDYLIQATEIKKSRLFLVSLFYLSLFPILLVKLYRIILSGWPFGDALVSYLISFTFSTLLWYLYFNKAFDIYDDIDASIELVRTQL
jgi:hypothetical protein